MVWGVNGQWVISFQKIYGLKHHADVIMTTDEDSVRILSEFAISICSGQDVVIIIRGGHMAWFKTWPRGLWSSCWMTARSLRYYKSS